MGDVHPYGNPHYLTDPVNGVRVAALLRDRFGEARPERAQAFADRYRAFASAVAARLVGPEQAAKHEPEEIVRAIDEGRLDALLGEAPGGWLGRGARGRGPPDRRGPQAVGVLRAALRPRLVASSSRSRESLRPTRHLAEVVDEMKADHVGLILSSAYFDPRHARWVAERTGARIVHLAHQVGARDGTPDYLSTVDYNVRALRRR